MSVPTDFFFAILGLVAGMVIVWLLESRRAFERNEEPWELPDPVEPAFIAAEMTKRGRPIDEDAAAEILEIHLAYLDGRAREEQVRTEREAIARARAANAADDDTVEAPVDAGADGTGADTPAPAADDGLETAAYRRPPSGE